MTTARVQSLKLSDQVTRVLAGRIVNGDIGLAELPPTEQDICEEFGVSKTTAREVIGALASRGLVTVRHGRRMEIRPVSEWNHLDPLLLELNDSPDGVRKTLGDLHDLRMLLEPEIAAFAISIAGRGGVAPDSIAIVVHSALRNSRDGSGSGKRASRPFNSVASISKPVHQ